MNCVLYTVNLITYSAVVHKLPFKVVHLLARVMNLDWL